ncbi:hypothetical protein ONE63_007809 [Megalurothrips usitatus]|uniref:Sec16 Sec23-binding domain-containing protein n=1 Tax=Megalurothrips usitatus TaxID=439358 RepID=A0AAV7XT26_9NEOP|nr:hypothetical protein ONE63_007809 [Megalurothrips usitatus]
MKPEGLGLLNHRVKEVKQLAQMVSTRRLRTTRPRKVRGGPETTRTATVTSGSLGAGTETGTGTTTGGTATRTGTATGACRPARAAATGTGTTGIGIGATTRRRARGGLGTAATATDRDRRARDKDGDYDPERRYDTRRDRDRDHRDRTKYNREEDEGESEDYGSDREERKWSRDRDADRDRNREGDRDRERERYRERDRFRDRDGYRDRDRERDRADRSYGEDYYRRERRGRDEPDKVRRSGGRRSDDYHRGYDDDYYRDRRSSRPSSRSGSVHEYGHAYERDYRDDRHERSDRNAKHNQYYPGGYYYNPQEYYRYQMYYTNLRKTDPEAYAAWYRKYYSQYAASQPGTYEDRGSVHSGRSSANEELNNQRFDRHRSPHRAQAYYQKSPQTSSSNRYQSTDNASPFSRESGRGVGHGESSLDETNSSIQRLTPFKFSTAHVKGILTRGGHLLKVVPSYPLDGQSATVEVHSMQSLIPQDQNLHDLLALPGPLVRGVTHKKTIILYLRSKMESTRNDPAIYDWQSVVLLYELLILLLRQNGMIVGTDIAELLLRNGDNPDADDSWSTDHRAQSTPSPAPSGGSRTSSASATPAVQVVNTSVSQQPKLSETEITNKFREFLLYGNTKEALEWAMKHGLWGHALFLSSKLDQRMYHSVMTRFANGLALTDPIQTLYQLLSGWQPAAVTCVADDKWGDWRPHLAMILSNTSSRPEIDHKAIMALGDTLSARGCLHASHFCYLMAQHPFGTYSQRTSKYVLLGSSHLRSFAEFASNEAIMITCIYEYARSLADPNFHIPNLQPYKYLMATRLVEANLLPDAVHYCEVVSKLIVQNRQQYETSFVRDVEELSESLKFHDPFYSAGGDLSAQGDPDWLLQLRSVSSNNSLQTYSNYSNYGESYANASYGALQGDTVHDQASISSHSMDPAMYGQEMPHQHVSAEPQQELVHQHEEQQPQLPAQTEQLQQQSYYYQDQQPWSLQEGHQQQTVDPNSYSTDGYGNVETDQSGWWNGQQEEVPSISMDSSAPMVSGQTNRESGAKASKPPMQEQPVQVPKPTPSAATVQPSSSSPPSQPTASAKTANRQPTAQANTQSNSSWFGGLWNKLALRPKNQMKLPDDKNPSIVWDDQKKRWVNVDGDGEEEGANLAPPPKMSEMPGRFAPPGPGLTPGPGAALVANGTAGMAFNTPTSSTVPSANEGENVGVKGPNMFKLPRGRSLRASYVDVMNPNGTKASGPNSLPPPNLFPTSASQPSSLNYFVPATVEGNENAPTDFLTPAPALIAPSESAPDQQPLSRWSSTSSLSREVQSYTSRRPTSRNQVQAGPGGPQMFNPAQFSQQSFTSSAPRKRYAN